MTNKLLGTAAALAVLAFGAQEASAQLELDLGGRYMGYVVLNDQDDDASATDAKDIDWLQETEIHFTGETTLDNGLEVGVHVEADVDQDDESAIDESYAYFQGSWGRFNAGGEDGAAYLLQVAAPSGDENTDGIRQFAQPFNYEAFGLVAAARTVLAEENRGGFDYDQDISNDDNKLTYLSPVFSGFQVGGSYTPEVNGVNEDLEGVSLEEVGVQDVIDLAVRYEGMFENVGVIAGAGYTDADVGTTDSGNAMNVGLDLDFGPFGIGASYSEVEEELTANNVDSFGFTADDEETIVLGADYTNGAFKFGVNYFQQDNSFGVQDLDTERYSGGVVYTYAPGMTFRGSVQYIEHDADGAALAEDVDGTAVLLGTQINF